MTEIEVIKTYGNVPLKFSNYYKYKFTFVGIAPDGARIVARYGGDTDVYTYNFNAEPSQFLSTDYKDDFHEVTITKDGEKIFEWGEYGII